MINGSNDNSTASNHGGRMMNPGGTTMRGGFGVDTVFADGSVRLISEFVDGTVWQRLGTQAAGQQIVGEY